VSPYLFACPSVAVISSPSTGAANIANKVEQTFSQAVDLSNAVPVVPDFLKAAPPK